MVGSPAACDALLSPSHPWRDEVSRGSPRWIKPLDLNGYVSLSGAGASTSDPPELLRTAPGEESPGTRPGSRRGNPAGTHAHVEPWHSL